MQTHDEETHRFFKHSSVQVLLCPCTAGKKHSWIKQREVRPIYTHHQKTVIVDADAGNNRGKIIAFLGSLDLCDGRYDTLHHPIFKTLQTVHLDDYHNPTYIGNVVGCPRELWHDLHCKIDGPAAYDVLTNFEERWLKASKSHRLKKLKMSYDDSLLRIERMPGIAGIMDTPCLSENDPEGWHVQIFRSIDSNSVRKFPNDPKEAISKNLMCGKNVLIDMSIHTAYGKSIHDAQHYSSIENQYFTLEVFSLYCYSNVARRQPNRYCYTKDIILAAQNNANDVKNTGDHRSSLYHFLNSCWHIDGLKCDCQVGETIDANGDESASPDEIQVLILLRTSKN